MSVYKVMSDELDTFESNRLTLTPWQVGRIDHMEPPIDNIDSSYGILLQTYFVAPQTGNYIFYSAVDDQAKVYLSTNENESQKQQIIYHAIANSDYLA